MKKLIAAIYFIGVFVVIILLACVLSQSDYVPFPEAMLPTTLHELAEFWLAIGFLPMTLATILFRRSHKNFSRIIYLPSLICAGTIILILSEILFLSM